MTAVGELELKGLPEPVPTFAVGWEPAAGAADLRTRTPYVGREREREVLAGRFAAAREGSGGLVLIAGEPGIGKTRLTNEVCAQFDDVVHARRRLPRRRRRAVRAVRRGAHRLGAAHRRRRRAAGARGRGRRRGPARPRHPRGRPRRR